MPKISVIVPVYNVENYIERCAKSLFEQTLDDIEYIFIDDCSPDKSIDVLQDVMNQFPNRRESVRIEQMSHNSRQAAVRKYGMQIATGDFIIHCDSDDWVDQDLYEKMYLEAIRSDADIVFCSSVDEYINNSILRDVPQLPHSGKELVSSWYHTNIGMHTWNKLVKRSIYSLNDIYPFDGINLWEDNGLMLRIFYYADKISYITGSAYHYNQANINSISANYGRSEINQMIDCARRLDDFFATKTDRDRYLKTVNSIKYLAKLNLVTTRFDWLNEFCTLFPECNEAVKYISLNAFSTKGKIRFIFVKFHLSWLFVIFFKLLNLFQTRSKVTTKE